MTNYEDFASLATWMTNQSEGKTPDSGTGDPLLAYIEQAVEAKEAPKAAETAPEAPVGATGDRTTRPSVGAPLSPVEALERAIGSAVDRYGMPINPNFADE